MNSFEDNTELFQKEKIESEKTKENTIKQKAQTTVENVATKQPQNDTTEQEIVATDRKTIKEGFEFAINLKKKEVSETTIRDYRSKSKLLQHYFTEKFPKVIYIDEITKKMMMQFLNSILIKSSPRTRNNYRVEISSMFQVLEDNEIIPVNFFKKIKVLKTNPERHKTYSKKLDKEIFAYLKEKDPILLLYIKFISYNFLRPIEINRIKVGDINIEEKKVSFKAKNKPLKTKIIPDILFKELPDLSKMNKDYYLFTPDKIGGAWDATEVNRRDCFSKRLKNVVKEHFNLGGNYGLYSFSKFLMKIKMITILIKA